ncbi:MAG: phospholipase [Gammaproteobacteria bacterium 28-57-27]|nr:MAG: phospholipase [Gammaproteobacteria bacterium 28-57-27]
MLVVFIHGWSVTSTETYGALPSVVAQNSAPSLAIQVTGLYLGKYISFSDEVNIDDIARGMQQAISTEVLPRLSAGERFACVTHSTGGPVVRKWVDMFFKARLAECPLSHLVMLAPPNHGSALAQLGKSRLSRMKFFAEGVQPGVGVLNWLELGSDPSWELNASWLDYSCTSSGMYVFVLTGQTIDRKFYDPLNSYTGEVGSDGVVRAAAANMNYGLIQLVQQDGKFKLGKHKQPEKYAFGILPGRSHSDEEMGIMGSVKADDDASHPTVNGLLQCLAVNSVASYKKMCKTLADLSEQTQAAERSRKTRELFLFEREFITSRYCMFVFRITDDRNNSLADYDLLFTAGPNYDENHLPEGFFVDRQRNQRNPGKLTYYIDYDKMAEWLTKPELQGKFGLKIVARPAAGYAYYVVAEHRGTFSSLKQFFAPNQTLMVDIQLTRHVTEGVFRLTQKLEPESFKDQPKGSDIR